MTDLSKTGDEIRRGHREALEPIATAIGHLCIVWADLEIYVNQLFSTLMETPDYDEDYAMIHCLDLRDQLAAIKVGAVAKTNATLAAELIAAVDYVDSVLRVRRNRYVHDRWSTRSGEVIRVNPAGKTFKSPGSGERVWQRIEIANETVEAINDTSSEVAIHGAWILMLTSALRDGPKLVDAMPPVERPPQRLLPPQPGTPHQ